MKTGMTPDQAEDRGVQHDSETPVAKKPSVLYLVSISLGILTIIFLATTAYKGIVGF